MDKREKLIKTGKDLLAAAKERDSRTRAEIERAKAEGDFAFEGEAKQFLFDNGRFIKRLERELRRLERR